MGCALLAPAPPATVSPSPMLRLVHAAEPATFGELERLAILIGERDPLPRAGVGRWLRAVFDIRTPQPLADQRLEALRRLVLGFRAGGAADATDAAVRAGVAPDQIDTLAARYGFETRG